MHATPIVNARFILSAITPPKIPQIANDEVNAKPARVPKYAANYGYSVLMLYVASSFALYPLA